MAARAQLSKIGQTHLVNTYLNDASLTEEVDSVYGTSIKETTDKFQINLGKGGISRLKTHIPNLTLHLDYILSCSTTYHVNEECSVLPCRLPEH